MLGSGAPRGSGLVRSRSRWSRRAEWRLSLASGAPTPLLTGGLATPDPDPVLVAGDIEESYLSGHLEVEEAASHTCPIRESALLRIFGHDAVCRRCWGAELPGHPSGFSWIGPPTNLDSGEFTASWTLSLGKWSIRRKSVGPNQSMNADTRLEYSRLPPTSPSRSTSVAPIDTVPTSPIVPRQAGRSAAPDSLELVA